MTSKTKNMPIFLRKNRLVKSRHTCVNFACISLELLYLSLVYDLVEVKVEVVSRQVPAVLYRQAQQLMDHQ
jgi:hypothetical protein